MGLDRMRLSLNALILSGSKTLAQKSALPIVV
jgi:hypothetical protein